MITAIVAYNLNFVIGDSFGKIPWHIPDDLKNFKNLTMGKPCVMGRKTWDSLPEKYKPLSGRMNCVITKNPQNFLLNNQKHLNKENLLHVFSDIESAINNTKTHSDEICIVGGGEIYNYCFKHNLIDRVLASEVKNNLDGVTFFPNLNKDGWEKATIKNFQDFDLVEYKCLNQKP